MKIRILLTGGTIDKRYDEIKAGLAFTQTHMADMLKQGRSTVDVVIQQVLMMDSLDMTDVHRQMLLKACHDAPEDKLLITHGTDTMVETAALLGEQMSTKTIVLCGAMIPYSFGSSDALFNLGSALSSVQLLDAGVYITMNGKIFSWQNVRKNVELGQFETITVDKN